MIKIAEGIHSTVFDGPRATTVIKTYKTKSVAQRELKFFKLCQGLKFIIQPISIELDTNQVILPKLIPLSNLNFQALSPKIQKKIIYSIIKGLQELHNKSIIHHDLKPDNILYDPITSSIKISDFSSSFQIDEFMKLGEEHKNLIANNTSPYHKAPFKLIGRSSLIDSDKYACVVTILQLYGFSLVDIKSDIKKVVCKLLIKNRPIYHICYSLLRSSDYSHHMVRSSDYSHHMVRSSDYSNLNNYHDNYY